MKKTELTYEIYNKYINALCDKVKASGKKYACVYPIPRGGYYAGIEVAKILGIPVAADALAIDALIVDDICDSGSTLAQFHNNDTAVVFCKPNSVKKCTYYGYIAEKDEWLVFPDEKGLTIEDNIRRVFEYIGEDANREGLLDTPNRIVRMWKEIFRGYDPKQKPKITTFQNGADGIVYDSMVIDEGDYYSMCEHHMMPFFGKYYFAYIPNPKGRILGISKVGRAVDYCAAKLQIQERLVHEVVDMLTDALGTEYPPLGMALVMKGKHLCKSMRGVKKNGDMVSSYLTGAFIENEALRAEFMNFVK